MGKNPIPKELKTSITELKTKVTTLQNGHSAMETKLEKELNELKAKATQLEAKVNSSPKQAPPQEVDIMENMFVKELIGLTASLGTAINVLNPKQPKEGEQMEQLEQMKADTATCLFNGLINQVEHVYKWDNEKKIAFFSALKAIPVFQTELTKLEKGKPKGASSG